LKLHAWNQLSITQASTGGYDVAGRHALTPFCHPKCNTQMQFFARVATHQAGADAMMAVMASSALAVLYHKEVKL
jgi:hypothetical protein